MMCSKAGGDSSITLKAQIEALLLMSKVKSWARRPARLGARCGWRSAHGADQLLHRLVSLFLFLATSVCYISPAFEPLADSNCWSTLHRRGRPRACRRCAMFTPATCAAAHMKAVASSHCPRSSSAASTAACNSSVGADRGLRMVPRQECILDPLAGRC